MMSPATQPVNAPTAGEALSRYPVQRTPKTPEQIRHEELTHNARKWVAQSFFGVMLKQMRNSPFKSELFSGGRGGEAFGSMYDQHLAERMANSAGRRLADSIVKQIERRPAPDAP